MPRERPEVKTAPSKDLDSIREQIENVSRKLSPLTASVERLSAPKEDISVPADISQSLRQVHGRLERLERELREVESQSKRMAQTFSSAILRLSEMVEKHDGALAHSLDKLLGVLTCRKLRIIRDSNGDMVAVETIKT